MNKIILTTIALILISINGSFADILKKEINKVKDSLTNKALNTKYALTPPKKTKKLISEALSKINSTCCEENFTYKNDLMEIKTIFEDCLNKKCQNFMLPIVSIKKPPKKILALRRINLVDDLLLENENQKYQNLVSQMEKEKSEQEKNQEKLKIQNEQDIQLVKELLNEKEKENESLRNKNKKLKNTVSKMLANYQKKIIKLKNEKNALENDFDIVFQAHSKNKQKKLLNQLDKK